MWNQAMRGIMRRGETYRFTVYLGRGPDGAQLRKYTTWRPPRGLSRAKQDKLASEACAEFRRRCRDYPELREEMRFSELCRLYFEQYAPSCLKEVTAYNYRSACDGHLLPAFGEKRLRELTTPALSRYFTTDCPLKAASCRKLMTVLSGILTFAETQGYLTSNPCKNVLCKKDDHGRSPQVLEAADAAKLSRLLQADGMENAVLFTLLHTGMRVGECLALRWEDVDFDAQVIHIRRTLASAGSGLYLSDPKTSGSDRSAKFGAEVFERLGRERARQLQNSLKTPGWEHPEMVFTTETGGFCGRGRILRHLHGLLIKNDLPDCTVHSLRHTFASILINEGVHIKAVSAILGHSSVRVTGDIYAHAFADYEARAAEAVSLALG